MFLFHYANYLTNFIINSYFSRSNCLLILIDIKGNYQTYNLNFNEVLLPYVLVKIDGADLPYNLIFKNYACQGVVIVGENIVEIFENFENEIKLRNERFNFRRYLLLPIGNSRNNFEIFKSSSMKYVVDILIVLENYRRVLDNFGNVEVVYDLFTHKYVSFESNTSDIVLVDRWFSKNGSFLFDRNLYPEKLQNQFGKVLRIATFTYKPYSVIEPLDGTDVLIALEYARKYNMTPKFIVNEIEQWGEIYDNWTGPGTLGNLVTDRADIGLGAIYRWEHEYRYLDLSIPVMRSGVTCLAPAPKLASGLITPFVTFSLEMWIMVFVSYILLSSLLYLTLFPSGRNMTKTFKNIDMNSSFMLIGSVFLLQSSKLVQNIQESRFVFAITLVLSLVFNSLYGSGLSSHMTVPRYFEAIHDLNDLIESDLNWGATATTWISSLESDTDVRNIKLVNAFVVKNEEDLKQLNEEEFVFAIERLQAGNFAIGSYVTLKGVRERRLLDRDLYWEYCVFMLRKNSILLPSVDKVILDVTESGLLSFWEEQVVLRHLDSKIQKVVRRSLSKNKPHGDTVVKLALHHVEGAFAILGVGLFLANCVLLTEIIFKKYIG